MSQEFDLPAMEMRDADAFQRPAATRLISATVEIAESTPLVPSGIADGATWRYGGESFIYAENADAPGGIRHIAFDNEQGTQFVVLDEFDKKSPVTINSRGEMTGGKIADLRRIRTGIRAGALIGSHELFVEKSLVPGGDMNGDAVLQASVTRTSTGNRLPPLPIVDLRLLRTNPRTNHPLEGDFTVIQSHRVEYATRTCILRVGHNLVVENYIPPVPGAPNSKGAIIYDSNPDYTSARLQQLYRPLNQLDIWLPSVVWRQLITEPLTMNDLMRAKNA